MGLILIVFGFMRTKLLTRAKYTSIPTQKA